MSFKGDKKQEEKVLLGQPLLKDEVSADSPELAKKAISDETIPFCEALASSTKMAFLVVFGSFFYPIYHVTNNIVLGHNSD